MSDVKFERFGIMLDCSRNGVMNIGSLKKWIDIISDLGYNALMLYTEDTYEIENQPFFGYLRGRYRGEELREIDSYALKKGIELIPCIQTLAHLNAIFRWDRYWEINDCNNILLAGDEKTYALIEDMFASLEKNFTSRIVNVGMDEAHMLGRGRYQDTHGFEDRFGILLKHLNRVSEIAARHGFKITMWGDMFFHLASGGNYEGGKIGDNVKNMIPDNVSLIYWDYYSQDKNHYDAKIKAHAAVKKNIWFAGGLWSWKGFVPHNAYSIHATEAALEACTDNGVKDIILTMWGDDGAECSRFALLPSLYYASELAKGNNDPEDIKRKFELKFNIPFDVFMLADLTGTPSSNETSVVNPEKYMLYNDPFFGMFDKTVCGGENAQYALCADKLDLAAQNTEYGYIFKTLSALCRVLELKWDLGVRSRKAYSEHDVSALRTLLGDYDELVRRTEAFYTAFREQWMLENKPNGFEIQDIRLGGLIQRTKNCRSRIAAYLDGSIESIPELEEEILPYNGSEIKKYYDFNNWGCCASVNVI